MNKRDSERWVATRQDFLKASGRVLVGLSATGVPSSFAIGTGRKAKLRFGIVTDIARRLERPWQVRGVEFPIVPIFCNGFIGSNG